MEFYYLLIHFWGNNPIIIDKAVRIPAKILHPMSFFVGFDVFRPAYISANRAKTAIISC
jgi:hypothetical protein